MKNAVKTLEGMERISKARQERDRMNLQDLTTAAAKGMTPPTVGDSGVYEPPGQSPVTFQVLAVSGMICKCRYLWQEEWDDPSCFIWGFMNEAEHTKFHVWPGHPDWGV